MRCASSTWLLSCVLLAACSVDRLPLTTEELVNDSGHDDASVPDVDANDGALSVDGGVDADTHDADAHDADTRDADTDAGDATTPVVDAGNDAQEPVDAFVPPPRYVGPCMTDHDCEADETCVRSEGVFSAHSYCAQTCNGDQDCDESPVGAGTARCSSKRCRLPCDAVIGSGCPSSMECQDFLLILPADDGTCSFLE